MDFTVAIFEDGKFIVKAPVSELVKAPKLSEAIKDLLWRSLSRIQSYNSIQETTETGSHLTLKVEC